MSLSSAELAWERRSQEDTMLDTCVLRRWDAATRDSYNRPVPVWAEDYPTRCGFSWPLGRGTNELLSTAQVPYAEATLRLPVTLDVLGVDRIKITHIAGEALATPLLFEVVGPARKTPSCLITSLRIVTQE